MWNYSQGDNQLTDEDKLALMDLQKNSVNKDLASLGNKYDGYSQPGADIDSAPAPVAAPVKSPLSPVTKADVQNPTPVANTPVSNQALAQLAKTRPDLVEAYKAKMAPSNDSLASARDSQDMGNYGNVAGKLLNDFSNSQNTGVRLGNRMQDLGKAPTVVKADRTEYDPNVINSITSQGVSRAKEDQATAEQDFNKETQLGQMSEAASKQDRLNNPNSPESIHARNVLSNVAPNATKIPGFATMTAAQAEAAMPELMKRYQLDQGAAQHDADMNSRKADRSVAMEGKLSDRAIERGKLSASQVGEVSSHDKAIAALDDVMAQKKNWDTGKLSMGMNKIASVVGLDDSEKSAFKSSVGEQLASYIKAISGATVSPSERASLLENVPSVYDNDATFEAKAQALKTRLERNRQIEIDNLGKSGKNVDEFRKEPQAATADQGELDSQARQKRIAELKAKAGK